LSLFIDIASWLLLTAGGCLMAASGLGLVRLPNLFARIHAGGLADTGGAALLILGMALQAGWTLVTVKLIMIGIFLFFTAPTAGHALAHAALLGGIDPEASGDGDEDEDDTGDSHVGSP
jgi:multicomponent Na+:H+ antiporter subunit G